MKLATKDERINELKQEIETVKHEHILVHQKNHQLQLRLHEFETNASSFDSMGTKAKLTISTLQKDALEKQEQILELQSRMRFVKHNFRLRFVSVYSIVFTFQNTHGRT